MRLRSFCVVLTFFLCSILSTYTVRSLPQPVVHSCLVLPESVCISIFISILFYFKTNFLCDNVFPDSGVGF